MSVIDCNDVSIRYITGDLKAIGLKEFVVRKLSGNYHVEEFWADRHINFKLEKGEMLGIIGSNGAGKSTILKAISQILLPAEGKIKVRGTIAALLELTSGFDDDMTVKENAYLRGAMLGYTRQFMDERYREIIEFAELEKFEDYQFKQLSSGMRSRLAFSIACLVDPDVLILDEVLSVGDGAFREKSGNKMREILKKGITAILVSHSISQVRELCDKILWLDHGKQIVFGDEVTLFCDAYEEFLKTKEVPQSRADIERLAADFALRKQKEAEEEGSELRKMLNSVPDDEAYRAAVNYLSEKHPDVLKRRDFEF